jgi:DNA-binding transcriptional LysR family regulator
MFVCAVPPIRKLQYVLAVARELHFRKAAEKLHVSQPAVSRQVRQCEEEFGFEILHRDHHFVALTNAGRSLVTDLDRILQQLDSDLQKAILRAQAISRQESLVYVIGHSPFTSSRVRQIAYDLQRELFSNLEMRLRILSTAELLKAIECNVVHAGITYAPIDHAGLSSISIGTDSWMAVVPANKSLAHGQVASIAEFSGLPIISNGADRTHPSLFRLLEAECIAGGFQFRTIAEVTSPNEAFDLVSSGIGMVLLPEGVCDNLPPGVRAIRITDVSPLETVLIHGPNNSELPRHFAEKLRLAITKAEGSSSTPHQKAVAPTASRKPPIGVFQPLAARTEKSARK